MTDYRACDPHSDPRSSTDADFDARMRSIHAQAVAATPARVRLQLRPRRTAVARPWARGWTTAAAFAVGLVALGALWQGRPPGGDKGLSPAPAPVIAGGSSSAPGDSPLDSPDYDDAYAALDESPELYVWLESDEASAMFDTNGSGKDASSGEAVTE
ncbi:hypothetical protein [Agrilutibacter solisilvae]|uniref:Uncharacterized protein n=1 Tax=Agrilutibacter solisilvae TaxID=2763317 RepID=A0A975AU48_9GAMM|nr:hypothetical protein [Lysobacter solisilvae]QSX79795.1 hypothetical protein I8J32_008180 [Lysobacter solisilvae]